MRRGALALAALASIVGAAPWPGDAGGVRTAQRAEQAAEACTWERIGTLPGGRYFAAAVVDPGVPGPGDEVLYVYGGLDVSRALEPEPHNEILRLDIPAALPPAQVRPAVPESVPVLLPNRWGHTGSLVTDAEGRRSILWIGGSSNLPHLTPTPTATTGPTPSATPTRAAAAVAVDVDVPSPNRISEGTAEGRGGGRPPDSPQADAVGEIIVYDVATRGYTRLPVPPLKLLGHAAAVVPGPGGGPDDGVVVFGGRASDAVALGGNSGYRLPLPPIDLSELRSYSNVAGVARVYGHSLNFSPDLGGAIMFGGTRDGSDGTSTVMRFRFGQPPDRNLSVNPVLPSGIGPVRFHHAATYDIARRRLVVYGGIQEADTPNRSDDTYFLDFRTEPPTWSRLLNAPVRSSGLEGATMVYDPDNAAPILIGGRGDNDASQDILFLHCRLAAPTATPTATGTRTPTPPRATPSPSPSRTAGATASPTAGASTTTTASATATATATRTATASPSPTATATPTPRHALAHLPLVVTGGARCQYPQEQEPNNRRAEANLHAPLRPHPEWRCGWLMHPAVDRDFDDLYWLEVDEPGLLQVWLEDIPTGARFDLKLGNRQGIELAASDNPADFPPGEPTLSPYRTSKDVAASVHPGERYYVRVQAIVGPPLVIAGRPYRVTWTTVDPPLDTPVHGIAHPPPPAADP